MRRITGSKTFGRLLTGLTLALAFIAASGLVTTATAEDGGKKAAPAFTLKDHHGNQVSLADHSGKIVVLEWFNGECPFVVRHHEKHTTMKDLAAKYKDKGVVWLAVNSSSFSTPEHNKKWAEKWDIAYPILDDASGQTGKAYGAKTTPHMYIVHKDGSIAYHGAIDDDRSGSKGDQAVNYVAKALDELLEGKTVSTPETKPYGCSVKYKK